MVEKMMCQHSFEKGLESGAKDENISQLDTS
jgi:hypothetical protein